jgi:hypothetical protein
MHAQNQHEQRGLDDPQEEYGPGKVKMLAVKVNLDEPREFKSENLWRALSHATPAGARKIFLDGSKR